MTDLEKLDHDTSSSSTIADTATNDIGLPEHEPKTSLEIIHKQETMKSTTYDLEPVKTSASRRSGVLTTTLSRTLSRVRTRDDFDPGPPPDGGFHAYMQAVIVHLVIFNTWGFINSFGLFQSYYTLTAHIGTPSAVSWIGTIQVWILFFLGAFSGRALDAGFFKLTFVIGTVIYMIGIFMLSLCRTYWQILLAQGVCLGIGGGLIFVPSLALVSTYFLRNRSAALGIAVTGSATGGLVFPAIAEKCLPSLGFGWTVRIMAFVQLFGFLIAAVFLKPRLPPRKSGPVVEWSAFTELPYVLYLAAGFCFFWSVYIGFFYFTSYARDAVGFSVENSIDLLMVMNGVGVFTRLLANFYAGYTGPTNMIIPFTLLTAALGYIWIAVRTVAGVWIFAAVYGFAANGIQGLFPVVLTSLTNDPKKAGVRTGMGFATVAFAVLTGSPIAGALIEGMHGSFLGCQIFAGTAMLAAGVLLFAVRWAILRERGLGWQWLVKV